MLALVIIGVTLVVLILLCLTTLRIYITYGRVGKNDQMVLEVTAWRKLFYYKYEVPLLALATGEAGLELSAKVEKAGKKHFNTDKKNLNAAKVKRWYENIQDLMSKIHDLNPILKHMLKQMRCDKLEWHTWIGLGDAGETGALTGLAWGIKSVIISAFSHYLLLRSIPKLSVQPVWNDQIVRTQFRCTLHFRLVHAFVAGTRILIKMRKDINRKSLPTLFRM